MLPLLKLLYLYILILRDKVLLRKLFYKKAQPKSLVLYSYSTICGVKSGKRVMDTTTLATIIKVWMKRIHSNFTQEEEGQNYLLLSEITWNTIPIPIWHHQNMVTSVHLQYHEEKYFLQKCEAIPFEKSQQMSFCLK